MSKALDAASKAETIISPCFRAVSKPSPVTSKAFNAASKAENAMSAGFRAASSDFETASPAAGAGGEVPRVTERRLIALVLTMSLAG